MRRREGVTPRPEAWAGAGRQTGQADADQDRWREGPSLPSTEQRRASDPPGLGPTRPQARPAAPALSASQAASSSTRVETCPVHF